MNVKILFYSSLSVKNATPSMNNPHAKETASQWQFSPPRFPSTSGLNRLKRLHVLLWSGSDRIGFHKNTCKPFANRLRRLRSLPSTTIQRNPRLFYTLDAGKRHTKANLNLFFQIPIQCCTRIGSDRINVGWVIFGFGF